VVSQLLAVNVLVFQVHACVDMCTCICVNAGVQGEGNTPLHTACAGGPMDVCLLLLDAGANVNALNVRVLCSRGDDAYVLHYAICACVFVAAACIIILHSVSSSIVTFTVSPTPLESSHAPCSHISSRISNCAV
jgi:hypothetical protein